MKCPIDQTTLVISERGGIEIDYCPDCRGVWLDRGELDKIIDRVGPVPSSREAQPVAAASSAPRYDEQQAQQARYEREHREWQREYGQQERGQQPQGQMPFGQDGYGGQRRRKKENWLSELFD